MSPQRRTVVCGVWGQGGVPVLRDHSSDTSRWSRFMSLGSKAVTGCLIYGAIATAAFAQIPATATKPPAKPAVAAAVGSPGKAGTAAQRAKASLEPLLQQGTDALAAGQYEPAREAFLDAIAIDPRNVKAHHGLAL